jgi:hypothetical protein
MQIKRVPGAAMTSPRNVIRVWLIERNVVGTCATQSS